MQTLTMIVDCNSLRRACDEGPLRPYSERIVALARDSVLLVPKAQASASAASWLGGEPELPEAVAWPVRRDGSPLAFLGQIDLGELARFPAAKALRPTGQLLFFFDVAKRPGAFWTGGTAEDGDAARVLYIDPSQETHRRAPPPGCAAFAARPLNFAKALTIPSVNALPELGVPALEGEQLQAYLEINECVFRGGRRDYEVHRVLGHPEQLQQGPCSRSCHDPLLLLQLGSDGDFRWAGGGLLYFEVPAAELEAQRFERVHVEMESA